MNKKLKLKINKGVTNQNRQTRLCRLIQDLMIKESDYALTQMME